jgi:hypothetical protein
MRILPKLLTMAVILVNVAFLSGCTEDKAQALVTAIQSFESQSVLALNAYETLFKEYGTLEAPPPEEQFAQSYEVVGKYGKDALKFDEFVAQVGSLARQRRLNAIEQEFEQLKASYSLLRSAYESLPAGSLLGSRYAACGQAVTAKLTDQLANFSLDVSRSPLYPMSLRSQLAQFKSFAARKDKENARKAFDALVAGINRYEAQHEDAIRLSLAAAEQGRKVSSLLARYDAVSVSDVLNVLQSGLAFAGSLKGMDVGDAVTRLGNIKQEMEKSPEWQRAKDIPLVTLAECQTAP